MGYGLLIMSIHLSPENVVAVAWRFGLAGGVPSGGAARAGGAELGSAEACEVATRHSAGECVDATSCTGKRTAGRLDEHHVGNGDVEGACACGR